MNHKTLVLIPARFESSRFPGKPLAPVSGKSLIQRVAENCRQAKELFELKNSGALLEYAVVTDDDRIEEHLNQLNLNVVRVDDDVASGTERIALAQERFFPGTWDFIVNLQGDEPLFTGELLLEFVTFSLDHEFEITTILRPRKDVEGAQDPNQVKCAYEPKNKRCLYFSRTSIPYAENYQSFAAQTWYHHIGIYGFRLEALRKFLGLPVGDLERRERLEQLRALAHGMSLGAMCTEKLLIGVDTPADVSEVEKLL